MSRFEPSAVREVATVAVRAMGYEEMKPEQLKVVEMFVRGNDVLGVLPTGYGKSLCLASSPGLGTRLAYTMPACRYYIFDHLPHKPAGFSIVLVVSPQSQLGPLSRFQKRLSMPQLHARQLDFEELSCLLFERLCPPRILDRVYTAAIFTLRDERTRTRGFQLKSTLSYAAFQLLMFNDIHRMT